MSDARIARELGKISKISWLEVVVNKFRDAEIMKGTQQILFKRLLQPQIEQDLVIEHRIDVFIVGAIRRCRHAKPQTRLVVAHDLLVALRACAVHFINDDDIE